MGSRMAITLRVDGSEVEVSQGATVLDAVNRGALDGGLTWPGLWAGKNSAAGLFGSPLGGTFGMGQNEFTAWLYAGGGR